VFIDRVHVARPRYEMKQKADCVPRGRPIHDLVQGAQSRDHHLERRGCQLGYMEMMLSGTRRRRRKSPLRCSVAASPQFSSAKLTARLSSRIAALTGGLATSSTTGLRGAGTRGGRGRRRRLFLTSWSRDNVDADGLKELGSEEARGIGWRWLEMLPILLKKDGTDGSKEPRMDPVDSNTGIAGCRGSDVTMLDGWKEPKMGAEDASKGIAGCWGPGVTMLVLLQTVLRWTLLTAMIT